MSSWQVSDADYVQSAYVVSLTRTCQVTSSVVVLYDHVLTFEREVDYVWNYNFAFGSICYLIIRYIGDALAILNIAAFVIPGVDTPNVVVCCILAVSSSITLIISKLGDRHHSCRVYFFIQSWPGILVLFLIQLVLQLRLYALYEQSKKLLVFMVFGYLCEISAMATIMGLLGASSQDINQILPGQYICAEVHAPAFYQLYIFWIPVMIYDGMLCLLALWFGLKGLVSGFYAKRFDGVYIAKVLVQGNAGYFFCILLACILNIAIWLRFGVRWTQVSEGWPASAEAVIGCRLILGLRSSLAQNMTEEQVEDESHWIVDTPTSLPLGTAISNH